MTFSDAQLHSCPSCGRPMRQRRYQEGWYCPACDGPSSARGPAHWSSSNRSAAQGPAQEFEPESLVGEIIGGRYRLEGLLGQGAMGAVYRGVQVALTKPYAVKVLLPSLAHNPEFVARFEQEARIAAAIRHPGLVEVFDYGAEEDVAYYVMELLHGQSLADHIKPNKALPAAMAARIVAEAADAVAAAHDRGVVHRDLKPANLFIARGDDGASVVKVLDFGVSKATFFATNADSPLTVAGSICGTPAYMSPEQMGGRAPIDGRSDIYALGVVLYRLLAGKVPFDAPEPVAVMFMHLERPVPPLEVPGGGDVPPALVAVLERALSKRPDDRFPTMGDFAHALRSAVDGREPVRAARPSAPATLSASDMTALIPADARPLPQAPDRMARQAAPPSDSPRPGTSEAGSRRWLAVGIASLMAAALAFAFVVQRLTARPSSSASTVASAEPAPAPGPAHLPRHHPHADPTSEPTAAPEAPPVAIEPPPQEPSEPPMPAAEEPTRAPERLAPAPALAPPEHPRSPEEPRARPKGELALTSKVPGTVEVQVGSAKLELHLNAVTLVPVPAGPVRVSFHGAGASVCSVRIDVLPSLRRALVFGPQLDLVTLREPSGARRLDCAAP